MVARFEPHKDQPTLISAAALLAAQGLPIEVDLVEGRREPARRISPAYRSSSTAADIVTISPGMRRDVPELLKSWDIVCAAAVTEDRRSWALSPTDRGGRCRRCRSSRPMWVHAARFSAAPEEPRSEGFPGGRFPCPGAPDSFVHSLPRKLEPRARTKLAKGSAARFGIETMATDVI